MFPLVCYTTHILSQIKKKCTQCFFEVCWNWPCTYKKQVTLQMVIFFTLMRWIPAVCLCVSVGMLYPNECFQKNSSYEVRVSKVMPEFLPKPKLVRVSLSSVLSHLCSEDRLHKVLLLNYEALYSQACGWKVVFPITFYILLCASPT